MEGFRICSVTGAPMLSGWVVDRLSMYFSKEVDAITWAEDNGYDSISAAYNAGEMYWTVWGEELPNKKEFVEAYVEGMSENIPPSLTSSLGAAGVSQLFNNLRQRAESFWEEEKGKEDKEELWYLRNASGHIYDTHDQRFYTEYWEPTLDTRAYLENLLRNDPKKFEGFKPVKMEKQ